MTLQPEIKQWSDKIYAIDRKRYARLIAWIKAAEQHYPPKVIASALERFYPFANEIVSWWGYLDKVLDKEAAKYNARDMEQAHEKEKRTEAEWARDMFGGDGLREENDPDS